MKVIFYGDFLEQTNEPSAQQHASAQLASVKWWLRYDPSEHEREAWPEQLLQNAVQNLRPSYCEHD